MEFDIYFYAIIILAGIAVFDLVVGVSNDAVNFLNSAIGSKVAPRHIILIVASFGIMAGVCFSSGMMEVARKGIFHPQFFTMPELLTLFMAVMIADIIVLDLFNTYGMPTSTTVSIVFELLGAALALSVLKLLMSGEGLAQLDKYINSAKALSIIGGILLSVVVAFTCGMIVQFIARLLFTFDYAKNLRSFGGLWGGLSMACILMFIFLKGAKGATFIPAELSALIKNNLTSVFLGVFATCALVLQGLVSVFKVNIFKPIVLFGTFSLALAFAANDLVNFIGVPVAGYHAYSVAQVAADPLTIGMDGLAGKVPSSWGLILFAGAVMVLALWFSRKAWGVTETEVSLSSHNDEDERFESIALSRGIVRSLTYSSDAIVKLIPRPIRKIVRRRFDRRSVHQDVLTENAPPFDLLRASTNLMVASIVISFATSLKLPLSTTYVTFMVAMGTSLADRAWGRETAVYRVSGVLTVIGGWFMTAILASFIAAVFCTVMFFTSAVGALALLALAGYILYKTHAVHRSQAEKREQDQIYNLKKITDASESVNITFSQAAYLVERIRENVRGSLSALCTNNRPELKIYYKFRLEIRAYANIIAANTFKSMRLLHIKSLAKETDYPMIISCLQALGDSYRDITRRSYQHVRDSHKGLLSVQMKELAKVEAQLYEILSEVQKHLERSGTVDLESLEQKHSEIKELVDQLTVLQNKRIHERSSKTRLSILYFALMGDMLRMARQSLRLLEIFEDALLVTGESDTVTLVAEARTS